MRQSKQELIDSGWTSKTVPFEVVISPDEKTIAMCCMTCGHPYKGVLVAAQGLVQCQSCSKKTAVEIIKQAAARNVGYAIDAGVQYLLGRIAKCLPH